MDNLMIILKLFCCVVLCIGYVCFGKCFFNLSWMNYCNIVKDDCLCEYCFGVNVVYFLLFLFGEYSYGDWLKVILYLFWNKNLILCNFVRLSFSIIYKLVRFFFLYFKFVVERII